MGGWWNTRLFVMVLQLRSKHVFLPVAVVLGLSELSIMVAAADPTVMLAGAWLGWHALRARCHKVFAI